MMEHNHAEHSHDSHHHHSGGEESIQELSFKASILERHIQELSEKVEYISQQLIEMEEFNNGMKFIKGSKDKEIFASLGKGIYVKASSTEERLFVNVGSGVIVKKTPEDTIKIIESQIKSFHEAKSSFIAQLDIYKGLMNQTLFALEKLNKN